MAGISNMFYKASYGKPKVNNLPYDPNKTPAKAVPMAANKPEWQNALERYKTDTAAAQSELQRAAQKASEYLKTGQMDKYNAAMRWQDQVRSAAGLNAGQSASSGGNPVGSMGRFEAPAYNPLSYDRAREQASNQLNPVYAQKLQEALNTIKNQAMGSGFYGQLPQVQYSADTAGQIEAEKQRAIAELAQALVEADKAEQERIFNRALQAWQANRGAFESDRDYGYRVGVALGKLNGQDTLEKIMFDKNHNLERDKFLWGQKMDMTDRLGYWLGNKNIPTMSREQFNYQKQQDAIRNAQGWASIRNRGSGGGSQRMTQWQYEANLQNQAANIIKSRIGAFRTPRDFDAQLQREVAMGLLDPNIYAVVKDMVASTWSPDEVLPTWKDKKKNNNKTQYNAATIKVNVPTPSGRLVKSANPLFFIPK